MSFLPLLRAACVATATCLVATSARADVPNRTYVNSSVYDYKITYMTDIDQKRTGLGGNGSMYCVPTACFNLFAYANFGLEGKGCLLPFLRALGDTLGQFILDLA